jgi:hypothetical protein
LFLQPLLEDQKGVSGERDEFVRKMFVGSFERAGWRLAGTLIPVAYIGWSIWLLIIGIALLITA